MKKVLQDKWLLTVGALGIVAITLIDLYALSKGVDGIATGTSVALIAGIIAGLGGFRLLRK